jgi:hypothetical protein
MATGGGDFFCKWPAGFMNSVLEPMGIPRTTQVRGDIKDHPKGTQQAGTNSVAISIQGMPFGHHTMLLPKFLFPWSMRWCV